MEIPTRIQPLQVRKPYVVTLLCCYYCSYLLLYSYVYLFYPTFPSTEVLEYLECSNPRFSLPQAPEWGAILHQRITLATRHVTLISHYMGSINARKCFWYVQRTSENNNKQRRRRDSNSEPSVSQPWMLPLLYGVTPNLFLITLSSRGYGGSVVAQNK